MRALKNKHWIYVRAHILSGELLQQELAVFRGVQVGAGFVGTISAFFKYQVWLHKTVLE